MRRTTTWETDDDPPVALVQSSWKTGCDSCWIILGERAVTYDELVDLRNAINDALEQEGESEGLPPPTKSGERHPFLTKQDRGSLAQALKEYIDGPS